MTYKLKISSKNQVTLPVDFLREFGLESNQEPNIIIYKDINGSFIIKKSEQIFRDLAGSLNKSSIIKEKQKGLTPEQIIELETKSILEYKLSKNKKY